MTDPAIRYEDLTEEDLTALPSTFSELASIVGGDSALKLCLHLGGAGFYFPKLDGLLRCVRDRKIRSEFKGSYRELAYKYNLTESYIRKIIKGEVDDGQESLF